MLGVDTIIEELEEKEKNLDFILSESRKIVRACSNSIKSIHAGDKNGAENYLRAAEEGLKKVLPMKDTFHNQVNHILQEYIEAKTLFTVIYEDNLPDYTYFNRFGPIPFLLGYLDLIGELKREMYECLRMNKKQCAEKLFSYMQTIYDEFLPIRFSNSILPEFRRKQDIARIQIEQARGELL